MSVNFEYPESVEVLNPMTTQFDISICVTAYNRAAQLERCLMHLLTFSSIRFELIIGDDASTDNTEQIVDQYSDKFPHIIYHKHKENIGFARNMDVILRMARAEYIYILSDDDLVFENALILMKRILDSRPTASCISGRYQSMEKTVIGLNKDYSGTQVRIFSQNDYVDLTEQFLTVSDGHPFIRREIFQRYCTYNDRSFCLAALFFKLLTHGDVLFLEQAIIQHTRSAGSLSTNLTESWFIDYFVADIELAIADIKDQLPANKLDEMRNNALKNLYFQAARRANLAKDYNLLWHFLKRAKAVDGVSINFLVQCEKAYLVKATIDRIAIIIHQLAAKTLYYQDTPFVSYFLHAIKTLIPELKCEDIDSLKRDDNTQEQVHLLETYNFEIINALNLNNIISLSDLINSLQLSPHAFNLILDGDNLNIEFIDPEIMEISMQHSQKFKVLHARYE